MGFAEFRLGFRWVLQETSSSVVGLCRSSGGYDGVIGI